MKVDGPSVVKVPTRALLRIDKIEQVKCERERGCAVDETKGEEGAVL